MKKIIAAALVVVLSGPGLLAPAPSRAALTSQQLRGMATFDGEGSCSVCTVGPELTGNALFFIQGGRLDHWRSPAVEQNTSERNRIHNEIKNDLVAFLLSLTDERMMKQSAPFDHPELFVPVNGKAPLSPGTRDALLRNTTMFTRFPAVGWGGGVAEGLFPLETFLG